MDAFDLPIINDPTDSAFHYDGSDFEAWVDSDEGGAALMASVRTGHPVSGRTVRRARLVERHIIRGEN